MAAKASSDPVRHYLKDIGRIPLLTDSEEIIVGRKVQKMMKLEAKREELAEKRDEPIDDKKLAHLLKKDVKEIRRTLKDGRRAKDRMVSANLRLVVSVAKKYTKRNMELLDIIQEGTIGLVRGVEKFDPSRGYKFSTYAYWWIRQGITRAIAEKSRAIRLPIHITENLNKLKRAQRELSQETGQMPTVRELAVHLELSDDEIKDLMCKSRHPCSLETRVGENRDTALIDLLEDEDQLPDTLMAKAGVVTDMRDLVDGLPDLQAAVVKMRHGIGDDVGEPMSMTAVGQTLNMSRDRVRTLEHKALKALQQQSADVMAYLVA